MDETIHGFQKTWETAVRELDAVLVQFVHEKTGLELAWLRRDEENKTFGIAFETLPENDTGVFHILEHSTLCGSQKYPVKEPFVELMKSSMNTFLNAMTYPDKTVYPVSSKNDKDFMNLVSVYLDAVFAPSIYHKLEIFRQEGWHYEPQEDGSVCYNGVVFNEMKGVYSDPDELTEIAVLQALFPDTPYHFSSGGDPAKIPDLTYEQFLDTHRRFYSPSNAYVFLDGNVDLDAVLALLDDGYLSHMEKGVRMAPPSMQCPVKVPLVRAEYEVSSEEEEDGAARLIFASVIGDYASRERIVAMEILTDILCGSNHAPLCKAILEDELAEDVLMSVQGEMLQPYVMLELRNMRPENTERAEALIHRVLSETAENGIDGETLNAAIANAKFKMQERDFGGEAQGVSLFLQVMESWLYGGAPEANLEVEELFASLEEKKKQGYFEQLIKEVLLRNTHSCEVQLLPSHTLGERRSEAEMLRISAELEKMSEAQIQKLYDEQNALNEWQMSEDTPETLASMPALTLADVDTKPENIPSEISNAGNICVLRHPIGHNGVCYVSMYFDINGLTEEEYSQAALLCEVLGKLDTAQYSAEQLTNAVRKIFGSLDFSIAAFAGENETDTCKAKLCVTYSTLSENAERAQALAVHILCDTHFDNMTAILNIVRQRRLELYQEIMMSGSAAALRRLMAVSTVSGVVGECSAGIRYYQYLQTLDSTENFDYLKKMADHVFCRSGLTVSFTGDIPEVPLTALECLPAGEDSEKQMRIKPWNMVSEGFAVPSDVAFAARGGNVLSCGGRFSGLMALAAHVISLEFLWNAVRVQGGAYGTGLVVRDTGFCGGYSYRDPSAAESLEILGRAGEYLKNAIKPDTDLTGAIIGTIAEGSPLLTVRLKGQQADARYFCGLTYENLCARREALLNATPEALLETAELLDRTLREQSGICVIGAKEQLDACGLEKIISL
jgi:presequence protease